MNEMYEMSLSIHIFSVFAMLGTLIIMMLLHRLKLEQPSFVKKIAIATVFYTSFMGAAGLTGTIMMAAKHLNFTAANLLMIVTLVVLIVLEAKRTKVLRMVVKFKRVDIDVYRTIGFRFELIALSLILLVSAFVSMAG